MFAAILTIVMLATVPSTVPSTVPATVTPPTETGCQSACAGGACRLPWRPSVPTGPTGPTGPVVRPAEVARPHAAVARIVVETPKGRNLGSGTLIAVDGRGGLVATCKHLFTDGVILITLTFPGGKCYDGRLLGTDPVYDVAAVRIARPAAVPVAIATAAAKPGETLSALGYDGQSGRFMAAHGRCRGYVKAEGTPAFKTLDMSGTCREGMSGGPILNGRGELVAVLWGTNASTVAGTYCGRISKFVEQFRDKITEGNEGNEDKKKPLLPSLPSVNGNFPSVIEGLLGPGVPHTQSQNGVDGPAAGPAEAEGGGDRDRFGDLLGGLADRLERLEAPAAIAAEAGSLAEAVPTTSILSLINVGAAALGYSTPPAALMFLGVTLMRRWWRRRKNAKEREQIAASEPIREMLRKHEDGRREDGRRASLNDDYARQLAEVFALSGHSQVADATLGREYDEELRRAEQSSNGNLAGWARDLRERVAQRFYRIHDRQPMPAEPVIE